MNKLAIACFGLIALMSASASALEQEEVEAATLDARVYTLYVGRGFRARQRCFSYQGRKVVVEGDMVLTVRKAVYWTNGDCDLHY